MVNCLDDLVSEVSHQRATPPLKRYNYFTTRSGRGGENWAWNSPVISRGRGVSNSLSTEIFIKLAVTHGGGKNNE